VDEIGSILLQAWNGAVWLVDHWEIIGLIVGPYLLTWTAKFVRLVAILGKVRLSMKDRTVGDTEAATIFWMIVSILLGFWPTVNHAVLDYAPDQQIAILKGYKFCAPAYRPEVAAVKNGS